MTRTRGNRRSARIGSSLIKRADCVSKLAATEQALSLVTPARVAGSLLDAWAGSRVGTQGIHGDAASVAGCLMRLREPGAGAAEPDVQHRR